MLGPRNVPAIGIFDLGERLYIEEATNLFCFLDKDDGLSLLIRLSLVELSVLEAAVSFCSLIDSLSLSRASAGSEVIFVTLT